MVAATYDVLADHIATIRRWIDDETAYPDYVIQEWTWDAEERLNNELRVVEQIKRTYATFDDNCAPLPPDWLEFLYVRPQGGKPLDFITNHDYWALETPPVTYGAGDASGYPYNRRGYYTTIGQTLHVWPPINPDNLTKIEICYYRKIIPLTPHEYDPIYERYYSLYRYCTLAAGAPYLIEDERLPTWAGLATAGINAANDASKRGRHSGSPIAPRIRSFG